MARLFYDFLAIKGKSKELRDGGRRLDKTVDPKERIRL